MQLTIQGFSFLPQNARRVFAWAALAVVALLLTGCGVTQMGVWPGVTADGSRVYVSYLDRVSALDITTQELLWEYTGEDSGVQFYAPPLIQDGRIVVGDYGVSGGIFGGGRLVVKVHAFEDSRSGAPTPLWVAEEQVSGRIFGQAVQADGKVFLGTGDNHFVALDASSGQKIWDFRTGNAVWDRPVVHDGVVYLTSQDKNVYALDMGTGNVIWSTTLGGASAAGPALNSDAGLLYAGGFDGQLYALDLDTGEVVWTAPAADWIWGRPVLGNGILYYSDLAGNVYTADAESGAAVWANPAVVRGAIVAPIALSIDRLFVVSGEPEGERGYVTALDLDGQQLWEVETPTAVRAIPVVAGDRLVVAYAADGDPLEVVSYNSDSGAVEWRYTPAVEE